MKYPELERLLSRIDIPSRYKPRAGRLLVAEPFMQDSWFSHSVALIVHDTPQDGTLGIVLNHLATVTLDKCINTYKKLPVFVGGPVHTNRLLFLHTLGDVIPDSDQILPGLWMGGDFDQAIEIINTTDIHPGMMRFFLGYSGWEPAQLGREIKDHAWAVTPPPIDAPELLKIQEDNLYHTIVRGLDHRYAGWKYHPADPHMN